MNEHKKNKMLELYNKKELGEIINKKLENKTPYEKRNLIKKCKVSSTQIKNIINYGYLPNYENFIDIVTVFGITKTEINSLVEGNIYYFCKYYPYIRNNGMIKIGKIICKYRNKKQMTQVKFSNNIGIKNYNNLTLIEHGKRNISAKLLSAICVEAEITFEKFVSDVKKINKDNLMNSNSNFFYQLIKKYIADSEYTEEELKVKLGVNDLRYNAFKRDNTSTLGKKITRWYIELLKINKEDLLNLVSKDHRYAYCLTVPSSETTIKEKMIVSLEVDVSKYKNVELIGLNRSMQTTYLNTLIRLQSLLLNPVSYEKKFMSLKFSELKEIEVLDKYMKESFKKTGSIPKIDRYSKMNKKELIEYIKEKCSPIDESLWEKETNIGYSYALATTRGKIKAMPTNEFMIALSRSTDVSITEIVCMYEALRTKIVNPQKELLSVKEYEKIIDYILFWKVEEIRYPYKIVNDKLINLITF